MMIHLALLLSVLLATSRAQQTYPDVVNATFPLTLAVTPQCGSLDSSNFTEINTGINLSKIRTIVAFGDSWTSNGANGTVPFAPIVHPPLPSAGSEFTENRRASNGYLWIENLASDVNAKLLNYAWGGAIIDNFAYNTTSPLNSTGVQRSDFVSQAALFALQGKFLDSLNPSQTLYTVSFGINDNGQFGIAGGDPDLAFNTFVGKLGELQAVGAKSILVQGMYKSASFTNTLQSRVFSYLRDSHNTNGTQVAFVNLERLFTAISNNPSSFGYAGNATCLISANTIVGGCDDPDHSVFFIPGHPSKVTHQLINDYTAAVVNECLVN